MEHRRIKIEELAVYIDSSVQTINNWYAWKKTHPDHELAKLLPAPEYVQKGGRKTRYWSADDIHKVIEFKSKLPHGRNGILGDITQRRNRRKKNG